MRAERGPEGGMGALSPGNRAPRANVAGRVLANAARRAGTVAGSQDRARHGRVAGRGDGSSARRRRQGPGGKRRLRARGALRGEGPLKLTPDRGGREAYE